MKRKEKKRERVRGKGRGREEESERGEERGRGRGRSKTLAGGEGLCCVGFYCVARQASKSVESEGTLERAVSQKGRN